MFVIDAGWCRLRTTPKLMNFLILIMPIFLARQPAGWVHAKRYTDTIIPRLGLSSSSNVIEIASNDGYLLRNF